MSFKVFSWRACLPINCIKNKKKNKIDPSEGRPLYSNQGSLPSRRISVSDVSSSSVSLSDLSASFLVDLHIFTYKELETITQSFSTCNYLGEGGFGKVYKGFIDDRLRAGLKAQPVAVKALKPDGGQGHREWLAEVIILGQLKHPHLVNLIGYCSEDEHMLLVYEFMERGNLGPGRQTSESHQTPFSVVLEKSPSCLHEPD